MLCFRIHTGGELLQVDAQRGDAVLKQLWHHSDAILCCSVKLNVISLFFSTLILNVFQILHLLVWARPLTCCSKLHRQASAVFTFANQAGLDMLETTFVALQDIMLDKVLDEAGRRILLSEFSKIMQQVRLSTTDLLFLNVVKSQN